MNIFHWFKSSNNWLLILLAIFLALFLAFFQAIYQAIFPVFMASPTVQQPWRQDLASLSAQSSSPSSLSNDIFLSLLYKNHSSIVSLSIELGAVNIEKGLSLDSGGDVDSEVVMAGTPAVQARRSGNGKALPAIDGNTIPDYYLQFKVDDSKLYAAQPTPRLRLEVEYYDQGYDSFIVQYDGQDGGPFGDGRFKPSVRWTKNNTGQFRIATFYICDAYFANRDNGSDLRIFDEGNGPETIRKVTLTLLPSGPLTYSVDEHGANPWDSLPDSSAIQSAVDYACPGDTVLFTSGETTPGYQGYWIDRTIFLVATTARHDLTFTASLPGNRALLRASPELRGFVLHLYAKSRVAEPGLVDDITLSHLAIDGGRAQRVCRGADDLENGLDDHWGSWLPECEAGDPWCRPGGLSMEGAMDWQDTAQDYLLHPERWSTGLLVDDVISRNTECGTALSMFAANSVIQNSAVENAGDHMHAPGCPIVDPDEGVGDWADGLTLAGPNLTITHNNITNPSDVGIVFFGGHDTTISYNTVQVTTGYYGAFAGIALHGWIFGNLAGVQVSNNTVSSQGDQNCGGMHVGINLGTHMWEAGCVNSSNAAAIGNANTCQAEPTPPAGALCPEQGLCQVWSHVPAGATLSVMGNSVSGAQINYLVEGLDLQGSLNISANTSTTPRQSDWESADNGCNSNGLIDYWDIYDWVSHHPSLPGWVDQRIHCER